MSLILRTVNPFSPLSGTRIIIFFVKLCRVLSVKDNKLLNLGRAFFRCRSLFMYVK